MLVLVALAIPVGVISAFVAKALLWLIAELTNISTSGGLFLRGGDRY